jgi:sugar phosphate permease
MAPAKDGKKAGQPSLLENLKTKVLTNWRVWCLAVSFLFVYLIRQGMTSWLVFYLIAEKGAKDSAEAAARLTGLELGGLFGSLLAGRLSDRLVKTAKPGQGHVGRRVQVARGYLLGVAAALTALWWAPAASWQAQWISIFMVGFFLYGPQMLIGLMGAEVVGVDSVGASEGFLGWVAYGGAAFAGLPLSLLVKQLGWDIFFKTLIVTSIVAFVFMSTLSNAKSNAQLEQEKEKSD